jgi:16S rRNA (guanine527-N7)-methyltransferase
LDEAKLVEVLHEAQRRGFLGSGPVLSHVEHSARLASLVGAPPTRFLDLGSGGGVPGLVLASRWPHAVGVLLDATRRRCEWLEEAVAVLGLAPRVTVRCGRAEELARHADLREAFPLVVARAFGSPATTAECAAGFLEPGGALVVSEPPRDSTPDPRRWPSEGLAELGLGASELRRRGDTGIVVTVRTGALSDRWPRRVGVPAKRPLWSPPRPRRPPASVPRGTPSRCG